MKTSFFSRFLTFTLAFYAANIIAIGVLTLIQAEVFFSHDFWRWLLSSIRLDVGPAALAELFRSPLMGLLFALLGPRTPDRSFIVKLAIGCGAFSYAVAFFISLAGNIPGQVAVSATTFGLIELSELGLPFAAILLARLFVPRNIPALV